MKVLVLAAHPDDETLGCGATLARLAAEGHEVHIGLLSEGAAKAGGPTGPERREQARHAAKVLGAAEVMVGGFPANRFDTGPFADLVAAVEAIVARVEPEVVYTHHAGDLHVDHALAARAALTATRSAPGSKVRRVLAFQVPASGDWALDALAPPFGPSVFVGIAATLERKVEALSAYGPPRGFPDPRSPDALRALARRWGSVAGLEAAEAFELVRDVQP